MNMNMTVGELKAELAKYDDCTEIAVDPNTDADYVFSEIRKWLAEAPRDRELEHEVQVRLFPALNGRCPGLVSVGYALPSLTRRKIILHAGGDT